MAHVLIIDDDDRLRQLLRIVLERGGHTATEACDGFEGARECAAGRFDVVLCDLLMPGREGLETIRELREAHPDLRVIAMSGMAAGAMNPLRVAERLGACRSLPKPFSVEHLLNTVSEVLRQPRESSEGQAGDTRAPPELN